MSYKDYKTSVEFIGCRFDDGFKGKINDIITSMERNAAPYKGSFELEVTRENDEIKTEKKSSEGLGDVEKRMLDELETMAHEISKKGGKPNKIKAETEVQKEV